MTATEFRPFDQAERDAVRDRIDENMCVEAGAGTGKTTVLVERIVETLRRGHARVQEMAVITFTEKAAAELALRVRDRLEIAREADATPDERARIETALRDLNRAHIETIHAFAAGLLRERPVEAGVDPGFHVLTDLPAQLEFEAAYEEWITEEMARDEPPPALLDALELGIEYPWVREAAEALHNHRDLLPLRPIVIADPMPQFYQEFGVICDTLRQLEQLAVNPEDAALGALHKVLDLQNVLRTLGDAHPHAARRAVALAKAPKTYRLGNQNNYRTKSDVAKVRDALDLAGATITRCADALKQSATAAMLAWLQGFVQHYTERRKAAGAADFDDLLIWARDLVRNDLEVRRYFAEQYRCILVDEFQDTDPLQAETIVWLCDDGSGATDWRQARLRPGSLFVVGDPKQSIYRFRRADIAMYDDVKRRLFGGHARHIVQNFRSVPPIIDWVNDVFRQLIQEAPGIQPDYVELVPVPADTQRPAMEVIRCIIEGARADDIRTAEADALASLVSAGIAGHRWLLTDGTPATYRDVAILIPSRAKLPIYEEALARADVPYRHEGGRTFFERQEVRELVAILRAIDDPADQVAAVAALRSSAFGLSDEDLILYGGSFNERRIRGDARGRVVDALRTLAELRRLRHTHILPDIIRAVLDTTQLVEVAMLQPQGEQVAANLLKIVDQARAFTAASSGGLRGFVRWLKENSARTSDETDASISEETDDVVRVVTVHASKGLEFPVVVFANMGTQRSDRTRVIPDRDTNTLHIKLGKAEARFTTPQWEAALTSEREHDQAEQSRLLYVAATRARDRLVVPVFAAEPQPPARADAKSATDLLRSAAVAAPDDPNVLDAASLPSTTKELPIWRRPLASARVDDVQRVSDEREAWQREHEAVLAAGSRPFDIRTATALKPEWEPPSSSDEVRRGRAADFGSAVHALLERINLARPDDAQAMAGPIAAEFGLPGRTGEIANVATNALRSDVIARARRSQRLLREVDFTARLPAGIEGVAEGRIDLLFVEDGELVIVDFKTDNVTDRDIDERAQLYRNQALVYAWAAQRAAGARVREVVFLFARPNLERTMRVDDAFIAEAEALLSGPVPADSV